jgi:uncharacterized protein with GYD domain
MARFAVFFRFKPETIKALMDHPSDRGAAVSKLCEAAGARMDAYYLMFGEWDGMVIVEGTDSKAAAAVSLAVSSSGAFAQLATHELLDPGEFVEALGRAGGLAYSAPGT